MNWLVMILTALVLNIVSSHADEYHYKDLLIGERAIGLGGAFVAISDDPSGIYYNPAGILFGLENYLSVSANAVTSSEQTYEDIYPGQNYIYKSRDLAPVLFGFTQSFMKSKVGFAVIVPNSDLIDQSDSVSGPGRSFTRKFFRENMTYLMGPAFATEVFENFSLGVSLFGSMRTVKTIDNTTVLYDPIGTGKYFVHIMNMSQQSYLFVPKVGVQYMPVPKWSFGITLSKIFNVSSSGQARVVRTKSGSDNLPVNPNGTFNNDMETISLDNVFADVADPLNVALGWAYFHTKHLLFSGELDVYEGLGSYREYPLAGTMNWALGAEYYIFDSLATRVGFFSNNSNSRPVVERSVNQAPHVDLLGLSTGVSLYREGTSLTLSVAYQTGHGLGQAFADGTLTQRVRESKLTLYLAGSYQL